MAFERLVKTEGGAFEFALGLGPLNEFLRQAMIHECAKQALVMLAAHHLLLITKSEQWELCASKYMSMACASLRQALQDLSSRNADGVLAASILLAWTTDDRCVRSFHPMHVRRDLANAKKEAIMQNSCKVQRRYNLRTTNDLIVLC